MSKPHEPEDPDRPPHGNESGKRPVDEPVDEPSGAQGTGGTGQPVPEEPGAAMPKPAEDPGQARPPAAHDTVGEPPAAGDEERGTAPQAPVGWLPRGADDLFGPGATAELAYELLTVDVPADRWIAALEAARDELGCTYFDWLSAVDEPGTGFRVCAHVVALPAADREGVRRMVLRTTVPHEAPVLPTATAVYAGAGWHERETHEMFGVDFAGHPHLVPLLLPDTFEGHPLRKDFVLAARVVKAWPGAKEPGESGHGGPKRRQMLPPGVPDPNEWGPLKGQLPPAPARPARGRTAAGDRPARRTRSASAGSASQQPAPPPAEEPGPAPEAPRPSRRSRSAGEEPASRAGPRGGPRSADAPWHHARPTFEEPGTEESGTGESGTGESGTGGGNRNRDEPRNDEEKGGEG